MGVLRSCSLVKSVQINDPKKLHCRCCGSEPGSGSGGACAHDDDVIVAGFPSLQDRTERPPVEWDALGHDLPATGLRDEHRCAATTGFDSSIVERYSVLKPVPGAADHDEGMTPRRGDAACIDEHGTVDCGTCDRMALLGDLVAR